MDLTQTKLSKIEWMNTEIPVNSDEKAILQMIIDGYNNINIRANQNQSLFQLMKIEYTPENEAFLYKKYFEKEIQTIAPPEINKTTICSVSKQPRKVDIMRMEHMDRILENRSQDIYEYVILDLCKNAIKNKTRRGFYLYTLIQLMQNTTISYTNKHVLEFVRQLIALYEHSFQLRDIIFHAHEYIEKNPFLLKYQDMTLFPHQKQLFSILQDQTSPSKLILYIAPTGTGKTLSPIGIAQHYRVIFICVARHVGLALAKSAISMGKKVAFAFGCETASDIRLHYFAASNYTINKRTGGIGKVDNSVGDKVEIMICDVKSYLTAMHYMLAFNEETNIITYWDEPTITMDYPEHELHTKIHENWKQNKISKMVLSCATLPKEHEIQDTLVDFRSKFANATIHMIESYDCKKSISILNKEGCAVLPHTISNIKSYEELLECVDFCEQNKTLLRYFDLVEIIQYLVYIHSDPSPISERWYIENYFENIEQITMNSLKLYYLETLRHIKKAHWTTLYEHFKISTKPKFAHRDDTSSLGEPLRKTQSVFIPLATKHATANIQKISSTDAPAASTATNGILLTTADAHTLTDGPTIFLAEDVEKIGKIYIKYSKIPTAVFDRIMEKIEKNNDIQKQLDFQQQRLEDKMGTNKPEQDAVDDNSKKTRRDDRRIEMDPEIRRITQQIDGLRAQIHTIRMDNIYVPNSPTHQTLWAGRNVPNAFAPNIEDSVVKEIMELSVENSMKVLLLLGIGMFVKSPNAAYMEIMKRLAYEQKLYLIIASSDYIYGTNYAFCHGFIGKDLTNMTQQKIIQAIGRVGRNKIQQEYTVRFRDDDIMMRLFTPQSENLEADNMCRLFTS